MQQDMPPVGFRFRPTDEELVGHYLHHKLMPGDRSIQDTLPEIAVCKYEPRDLPAVVSSLSLIKSDDSEWFFFSPRVYKYANRSRSNRATSCGYWKATGKDRKIWDRVTNNVIGTKKILVFYQGPLPGVKTNWVIHEYHDALFLPNQRTHVLCKLLTKPEKKTKEQTYDELVYDESGPNHNHIATENDNPANGYMIPEVHYSSYMDLQKPPGSDDFGDSKAQTPPEGDSNVDDEYEEFDYTSFLCSSPSRNEN